MSRTVHCVALDKEAEGLAFPPYPGELGKRIFENISKEAWDKWLAHQTILINEHRLSPINPEHRKYLEQQMENYLFGEGAEMPEGFVPPES
ncbi:MAG: oxidative damage protection protein [Xanthomonadales bacterium]